MKLLALYFVFFVMIICLFLFQISSRAAMFNKFELSWVELRNPPRGRRVLKI